MAAYGFPLLIKNLLLTPLSRKTPKEIVYRDRLRFGYPELRDRIARLGSALSRLGVRPGDTVAVIDWDSHRYVASSTDDLFREFQVWMGNAQPVNSSRPNSPRDRAQEPAWVPFGSPSFRPPLPRCS